MGLARLNKKLVGRSALDSSLKGLSYLRPIDVLQPSRL